MRLARPAAIIATTALVAASTALAAAPAYAEETIGEVTFYGSADFGQETGSYPAGVDWFYGDDSDGTGAGTATFGPSGLAINDGSGTDGIIQILNQNVTTPATDADLIALIDNVWVYEDSAADPGAWSFQLPLFAEGTGEFTTLRPATLGTASTGGSWITSQVIYAADNSTIAYAAGASDTLANLLDAIYNTTGNSPTILAYGLYFQSGQSPVIHAIYWDEMWSAFTPVPERTIAPGAEVTVADTEEGITLSGSGWIPGSEVYVSVYPCEELTEEELDEWLVAHPMTTTGDEVAGPDGTFEMTFSFDPGLEPGTYCYYLDDDAFLWEADVLGPLEFEVLPEELAATGADPMSGMLAAAGLLGLGALLLALLSLRRRSAAI